MTTPPKPWSAATFEALRPELCRFVAAEVVPAMAAKRLVVITAPVKSGKREIVEYLAARDGRSSLTTAGAVFHVFVTAFHRLTDEHQRGEIARHGVLVYSGETSAKMLARFAQFIAAATARQQVVYIHVDECDYGSEWSGGLGEFWRAALASGAVRSVIHYSATPQEASLSPCFRDAGRGAADWREVGAVLVYRPPPSYCGAAAFLDAGLVREAEPFVAFDAPSGDFAVTPQGRDIIAGAAAAAAGRAPGRPARNVVVVRLPYVLLRPGARPRPGAADRAIYCVAAALRRLREFDGAVAFLDKNEDGGIPAAHRAALSAEAAAAAPASQCRVAVARLDLCAPAFGATLPDDRPVFILLDQTSMRSSEWSFHDRIYAVHEYRPDVVAAAAHQSVMRAAHYATRYPGGFQPIRLYCSVAVVEFAAGRADLRDLLNARVGVAERVAIDGAARRAVAARFYPFARDELAREYRRAIERIIADAASPDGGLPPPVRDHRFVAVRAFTFAADGRVEGTFHTTRVFQFSEFAGATCADAAEVRVCVCYRDGTPGVALIYPSGAVAAGDVTAEVVGSMYGYPPAH